MDRAVARIEGLIAHSGEERIRLLRHCALSVTMEPLFLFLVGEYRLGRAAQRHSRCSISSAIDRRRRGSKPLR